jgi:hypothetical protein
MKIEMVILIVQYLMYFTMGIVIAVMATTLYKLIMQPVNNRYANEKEELYELNDKIENQKSILEHKKQVTLSQEYDNQNLLQEQYYLIEKNKALQKLITHLEKRGKMLKIETINAFIEYDSRDKKQSLPIISYETTEYAKSNK